MNVQLLREDAKRATRRKKGEVSDGEGKKRKMRQKVALVIIVVSQSSRSTRRRLRIEEEKVGGLSAESVSLALPPVAQPIIFQNLGIYVGVPKDPKL